MLEPGTSSLILGLYNYVSRHLRVHAAEKWILSRLRKLELELFVGIERCRFELALRTVHRVRDIVLVDPDYLLARLDRNDCRIEGKIVNLDFRACGRRFACSRTWRISSDSCWVGCHRAKHDRSHDTGKCQCLRSNHNTFDHSNRSHHSPPKRISCAEIYRLYCSSAAPAGSIFYLFSSRSFQKPKHSSHPAANRSRRDSSRSPCSSHP